MPPTVQIPIPAMEVKRLGPTRTTTGPADGQGLGPAGTNGLSLLVDAVSQTCSEKEAAYALGLSDQTYWSKVKNGEKPAPRVDRLTELPEATQRHYVERWGRQLGMRVTTEEATRVKVARLVKACVEVMEDIA
jgi:hypothetical protein